MKVKIISIDLYTQSWSDEGVHEGEDVYTILTGYYQEDEKFTQFLKDEHQKNSELMHQGPGIVQGLHDNGSEGWVVRGEEEMLVILPQSN